MKDNNDHICTKIEDSSIEDWMVTILQAYKFDGVRVEYRGQKTNWYTIEDNHRWDFYVNEYRIVRKRRYIINIDKDGVPEIIKTEEDSSDLNIGLQSDGGTYILMEEVQY